MKLDHPALVDLLKQAYSAEKAAAFAYQGHAASVKDAAEKKAIKQIEDDEWEHRREVLQIMNRYDVPVSKYYELRFHVIGKLISFSCFVIGRFMPFYYAGRFHYEKLANVPAFQSPGKIKRHKSANDKARKRNKFAHNMKPEFIIF